MSYIYITLSNQIVQNILKRLVKQLKSFPGVSLCLWAEGRSHPPNRSEQMKSSPEVFVSCCFFFCSSPSPVCLKRSSCWDARFKTEKEWARITSCVGGGGTTVTAVLWECCEVSLPSLPSLERQQVGRPKTEWSEASYESSCSSEHAWLMVYFKCCIIY